MQHFVRIGVRSSQSHSQYPLMRSKSKWRRIATQHLMTRFHWIDRHCVLKWPCDFVHWALHFYKKYWNWIPQFCIKYPLIFHYNGLASQPKIAPWSDARLRPCSTVRIRCMFAIGQMCCAHNMKCYIITRRTHPHRTASVSSPPSHPELLVKETTAYPQPLSDIRNSMQHLAIFPQMSSICVAIGDEVEKCKEFLNKLGTVFSVNSVKRSSITELDWGALSPNYGYLHCGACWGIRREMLPSKCKTTPYTYCFRKEGTIHNGFESPAETSVTR